MSYVRFPPAAPFQPTGGVISFLTAPWVDTYNYLTGGEQAVNQSHDAGTAAAAADTSQCEAAMNAATSKLDAQTEDMARNWKPTGYYTVADLRNMTQQVLSMLSQATSAVDQAIAAGAPADIRTVLRDRQTKASTKAAASNLYITAINTATAQGVRVVDAPSFKDWVIDAMNAASNATGAVAYMACLKPAIVSVLQTIYAGWAKLVALGKALAAAAVVAGEQILKLPDTAAKIWTYAKWGGLAAAAFYAYKAFGPRRNPCRKTRRRRSRS